ncbi:helix-turn-helix transcriptional regulator [Brevundimonas vesicularis]|uniref:helix-turn-helix transcriptional regulator n=1 Tax=Brevundimonas vesicularis TaxID=41276 RepID=UPI0038D3999F
MLRRSRLSGLTICFHTEIKSTDVLDIIDYGSILPLSVLGENGMPERLTARQLECLTLTRLMSDKEIAQHLNITESTVKKHVYEACQRLGVNRRKAALAKLERFVPPPTSHPIPSSSGFQPDHPVETGECYEQSPLPASMDLGRSGGRDGTSNPGAGARSSQATSSEGPQRRRPYYEPDRASERVAGSGPATAESRFGYKPPPANTFVRLILIVVSMALTALVFSAISSVVITDQHRIQTAVG